MNGLSIFQIKVSNKYTGDDFDEDLRTVLRRAGCKGEKICFIMDESNVLDSGFLERMNTLLANAEVPGLFEGDEHAALKTVCKEGWQRARLARGVVPLAHSAVCKESTRRLHHGPAGEWTCFSRCDFSRLVQSLRAGLVR